MIGKDAPIEAPHHVACGACGKPLNCLDSYGLTVPVDGKVSPADFCGLSCLATWVARHASEGTA